MPTAAARAHGPFVESAPGRVCLVGEHCDWAGGASVVVPVDRRVEVHAEPAAGLVVRSRLDGAELRWSPGSEVPRPLFLAPAVAEALRRHLGVEPTGHYTLSSDLPAGRGLSSSAAFCVALARAMLRMAGQPCPPDFVAELAFLAEHEIAGVACGRLDPLASAHGLPLYLGFPPPEAGGRGGPGQVEPLPAHFDLAVGTFPTPRDTHAILDALSRHWRGEVPLRDWDATRRVGAVRAAIEGFAAQAEHARVAMFEGDLRALGGAMDTCQEIYEEELAPTLPELRAPGLVRAVRELRAAGALGAKFSGAGGDGSVIGLFPPGGAARAGVTALDTMGLDALVAELWVDV